MNHAMRHVHLTVKAESKHGKRLNPRKPDLRRWREVFAEQLRERGIDAEASRQLARGPYRKREELWQVKAREEGRLRVQRRATTAGALVQPGREAALDAWWKIASVLANSESREDRALASEIAAFVRDTPATTRSAQRPSRPESPTAQREIERVPQRVQSIAGRDRKGPEIER